MRILILGANGYLGSKMVCKLAEQKHEVVCAVRNGADLSRLDSVAHKVQFIEATVEAALEARKKKHFDWLLNMACNYGRGGIPDRLVIESNTMFPMGIMDALIETGTKNVLSIGTGLPEQLNTYSFSKSLFARFGSYKAEKNGIHFINMKLEMFYGSDEPQTRFLPSCICRMLKNEPLELTAGTQRRDIVTIEDVVEAILFVIRLNSNGYQEFSVGTGEGPSVREVLTYAHEVIGSASKLDFGAIPMRQGESDCIANPLELTQLGFTYKYDWKSGISKMIHEMEKRYNV